MKERQEKMKRAVEEEEKRAREMKQREVGRGHEMRAEDGHKEERGNKPDPRLSPTAAAAGRELDLIHKNVNIRGNLLG